uniref:RNA polymerase II subunit B1 CTD phosphatase RPAP2 homolog n=1 Tax=Gouania willdenowi TaxID=441366 RepID=A0A8C5E6V6_GOUWI
FENLEKNRQNDTKKPEREEIKERLMENLELEKRALEVVERLLEEGVAEHFLVDCAQFITAANYKDVVEERSIARLCGYPVCPNKLGKILTQQYMISTKTNKVYDITERKCFCSNFCYKASKEFELQIPKSPLWLRQHETPEEIKLLNKGSSGRSGEEVQLKEKSADIMEIQTSEPAGDDVSEDETEQDFISSVRHGVHWDEDVKVEQVERPEGEIQPERDQQRKEEAEVESESQQQRLHLEPEDESRAENLSLQMSVCDLGITQVSVSRRGAAGLRNLLNKHTRSVRDNLLHYLRTTLKEWCTPETRRFLHGTEQTLNSIDTGTEEEELDEDDLSNEVIEKKRASASVPDYLTLQKEAEQLELRVQEFYKGTWVLPEDQAGDQVRGAGTRVSSLPPQDSKDQHVIQKRIVVDKLSSCLRNIVGPLSLAMSDVSSHLNNLVRTFRLTNTNIIHRSPEWTLISVVLLHLLSDVSPVVREALAASASVQYLKTLMEELGLRELDLLHLVQIFESHTH